MKLSEIKQKTNEGVGRITKQNTTVDVKPGETKRQAAKFGNKLNKKNEPPLLHAKARKNSTPHVLSNLGLAESSQQISGTKMLQIFNNMHHENQNSDMSSFIKSHDWKPGSFTPDMFPSEEEFFDYDDPFDRVIDINYSHNVDLSSPIIVGPQYSDGKYSVIDGNHRAGRAQQLGKTINAFFPVKKNELTKNKLKESTQLTELFNKAYKWKWTDEEYYDDAVFKTQDGRKGHVAFGDNGDNDWSVDFTVGGDSHTSGKGDAMAIFGTVMGIIGEFMEVHEPDVLRFRAFDDEDTGSNKRAILYKRMMGRYAPHWGMSVSTSTEKNATVFTLTRQVTESDSDNDIGVNAFAKSLESKYNLKSLFLSDLANRNAIEVSNIIVNRDKQKQGTGTAVMQAIVDFAEQHGRILVLDPAIIDKRHGTTSQSRLRKFYKRFGFIENKGRNKNYEFRQLMIRYPDNKLKESVQLNELFNDTYPWNWVTKLDDEYVAKFDTQDGQVNVYFTLWPNIGVNKTTYWGVVFNRSGPGSSQGRHDKTGQGDQFRIFATVMDIIGKFFAIVDPQVPVKFSAEKEALEISDEPESREKLYARMIKKFAGRINRRAEIKKSDSGTVFYLLPNNISESKKSSGEIYQLELIRDGDEDVLKVTSNKQPSWVEIRGKRNYETTGYDPDDRLHIFLDKLDPATVAALMAGDKKFLNPNNPRTEPSINMAKHTMATEDIKKPHPKDTLGVKRKDMPQVHKDHYPEFIRYLKDHGARVNMRRVHARELKPVQSEFSDAGVEKMMNNKDSSKGTTREKPLIVSSDNYIIDGHHRWLASYNLDEDIPIMQFSIPIKKLFKLVKDFKHTTYKDIHETTLTEVFDNPYEFQWTSLKDWQWVGKFKTDEGSTVTLQMDVYDVEALLEDLFSSGIPEKDLPKLTKGEDVWTIIFSRDRSTEVTGQGDAPRIFATVIHAINEWFRVIKPKIVDFTADKDDYGIVGSRAKLYQRLANMFAKKANYKMMAIDAGRDAHYIIASPSVLQTGKEVQNEEKTRKRGPISNRRPNERRRPR